MFVLEDEPNETMNGPVFHLVEELIYLGQQGIVLTTRDGQSVRIKVRLVQLTADSPAKWEVLFILL